MRIVTQLIPLVLIAVPPAIAGAEQPVEAGAPLFHLNFDESFAANARGEAQPSRGSSRPDRVEGIDGHAARFAPGQTLSYQTKGNLHKPEGTLSFWIKLPAPEGKASRAPVVLFSEQAPEEPGNSRLHVELYPGRFIRLNLNDSRNSIVDYHGLGDWKPDEWHHVAITWNSKKGGLFYVDGVPAGISWVRAWEPVAHDTFVIGSAGDASADSPVVVLDDVRIYDRELTPAEARAAFGAHRTATANVLFQDPVLPADVAGSISVLLRNPGERALSLSNLRYEIEAGGSTISAASREGRLLDTLLPGLGSSRVDIPFPAAPAGDYRVRLTYLENGSETSAETSVRLIAPRQTEDPQAASLSALTEIDATEQNPVADLGGTRVVTSPAGEYREAGSKVHDRFAMAFEIEHVNEPHVAIITYPDDKPRSMEILLQNFGKDIDFQVHGGVITGGEFPLSNTMREHRVLFWPRDRRQAFTFMTGENDMPAAVAGITIKRLDQFPISTRKGEFSGSVPARRTGIYYEDPVLFHSFGTGTDLDGFTEATDRLVDYMQVFGQTEFEYPLAWYGGPLYDTGVEAFEPDITGGQGGLRPHPPGYPLYLMQRLDEQGMRFSAGLHLHTLPSLDAYAITDWSRINADHDTVINVNKDGKLWYGYWHGSDLNYNPADPRVMSAVNAIVDEVLERYADQPALDAIALVVSRTKIYSFGSLASGYNDSNLRRFQQESGITIPVYKPEDPKRFTKSYEWIMDNAKEAWIDWRCQVLYRHYADMADRIAAARSDLKLKLNVFVHPSVNHRLADYLRVSSRDLMREMGIDPELFRNHPNVVINPTVVPADFRWMRRSDYLPDHPGVSRGAFTAPEVLAPLKDHANVRVTIHDRYWEDAIGKEAPLQGLTDIGVQEMVWRASTLNPAGFNSLEPYAFALHHVDATEVIKGGYVLGTLGMERELEPFSRAFAALPATKFDDVAGAVDPVRIRQQIVDGRRYFYVLNTLPEPVDVTVTLAEPGVLTEPAEARRHHLADTLSLRLEPYALQTFVSASTTQRVLGANVTVDEAWLKDLETRYRALLAAADAAGGAEFERADYVAIARNAWQQRHYSRLYFLLQEVWAADLLAAAKTRK